METVLVTGGAHGDLPTIRTCKELGYRVVTGGNRPSDPGHRESHAYEYFDYTDAQQVAQAAIAQDAVGLIPSCHDLAAIAASRAANEMKFPGHDHPDVSKILHNKNLLRSLLQDLHISTPQAFACDSLETTVDHFRTLGRSALLKPPDLAGGRGITRIDTADQIAKGYRNARHLTQSANLVLEEYIEGTHHGVTMLLCDQKPVFVFADDEYYGENPFRVAGAIAPTSLSDGKLAQITVEVSKLARHLELVDGLLHLQVIAGLDDIRIIEICRRIPGDFYPRLVELAAGYPYTENIIFGFLGLGIASETDPSVAHPTIRHVLTASKPGVISRFRIPDSIRPYVVEQESWVTPGARVADPLTWSGGVLLLQPPLDLINAVLSETRGQATAITT